MKKRLLEKTLTPSVLYVMSKALAKSLLYLLDANTYSMENAYRIKLIEDGKV